MHKQVAGHYCRLCRVVGLRNTDVHSSIAVIDSIYESNADARDDINISKTVDFINQQAEKDTTGHGMGVMTILAGIATNADFHLYRVVRGNEIALQRDVLKALGEAHLKDDVDMINLSIGYDHSNGDIPCDMPNEPCKVRDATQQAIDDGIVVVAAAGNDDPHHENDYHDESMCCPAILDDVITVGGFAPLCTAEPPDDNINKTVGSSIQPYPPLSCWILPKDSEPIGTPICSGLGCSINETCDENMLLKEWDGNVPEYNNKPDILAPVAYPIVNQKMEPDITRGTSYAAPFVAGALLNILTTCKATGKSVSPTELRSIVSSTGEPVDEGKGSYLNAENVARELRRRKGIKKGSFEYETEGNRRYSGLR